MCTGGVQRWWCSHCALLLILNIPLEQTLGLHPPTLAILGPPLTKLWLAIPELIQVAQSMLQPLSPDLLNSASLLRMHKLASFGHDLLMSIDEETASFPASLMSAGATMDGAMSSVGGRSSRHASDRGAQNMSAHTTPPQTHTPPSPTLLGAARDSNEPSGTQGRASDAGAVQLGLQMGFGSIVARCASDDGAQQQSPSTSIRDGQPAMSFSSSTTPAVPGSAPNVPSTTNSGGADVGKAGYTTGQPTGTLPQQDATISTSTSCNAPQSPAVASSNGHRHSASTSKPGLPHYSGSFNYNSSPFSSHPPRAASPVPAAASPYTTSSTAYQTNSTDNSGIYRWSSIVYTLHLHISAVHTSILDTFVFYPAYRTMCFHHRSPHCQDTMEQVCL